jgi:hypothetical protein
LDSVLAIFKTKRIETVPPITGYTLPRAHTVTSLTIGGLNLTLLKAALACLISEEPDLAT